MDKRIIIAGAAAAAVIGVLCAVQFGGAYYFQSHFTPNTIFNGVEVGGESVDSAKQKLDNSLKNYTLTIKGKNNSSEDQLSASSVGLAYDYNSNNADTLDSVIAGQNAMAWAADWFGTDKQYTLGITFDSGKLDNEISSMNCMNPSEKIPSQNASLEYKDGAYQVIPASYGNEINPQDLKNKLVEQLTAGNTEYEIDCYTKPALVEDSDTFKTLKSQMDTALKSSVTIKRDDISVSLTPDQIASYLIIGDNFTAAVDKNKLSEFVNANIKDQFNTVGKTRTVSTLGCGEFQISGGIYGYIVNVDDETEQLAQDILSGTTIERQPKYSQEETYSTNGGLGDTYIDVSISQQRVWLVYNGNVIVDTPCVTGNVNNGTITPTGMYWIEFKRRNYDMPRYGVSVSYWMPIDTSTGVGLHDASWRNTFGGNYYITTGSHGCINLPVSAARTIYNNCFGTMPVVVH